MDMPNKLRDRSGEPCRCTGRMKYANQVQPYWHPFKGGLSGHHFQSQSHESESPGLGTFHA